MKLEVSKTELLRGLEVALRAVNAKSPLPIYGALMLAVVNGDSDDQLLKITGTDGELTLSALCGLESEQAEAGQCAVFAEGFATVVKGLPGPLIRVETEKTTLVLKSGRSRYTLPLLTGESWPVIPSVERQATFAVNEKELAAQLARVVPAVGTDTSRIVICGTYWSMTPQGLSLVATDTHRLHVASVPIREAGGMVNFVLGTNASRELIKVLAADEECRVSSDGACLRIEGSWGTFVSTLIGEKYVAYERFIPERAEFVEFGQGELSDAIKRAAYVAQGCADRLVVTITDSASATLEAASESFGEAEEELVIRDGKAEAHQFAVSARNLGAAVAAVPDPIVRLYRGANMRAVLVAGEDTGRFFAVVMRMKLPSDA